MTKCNLHCYIWKKKLLFVTGKGPQWVSWGKWADHRHLSKHSLYCIQTKSPNVQCHKDLKIQWDATSLNVPEQSNKLFRRTCWNEETMLIHERFCPIPALSVKANEIIFCMIHSWTYTQYKTTFNPSTDQLHSSFYYSSY